MQNIVHVREGTTVPSPATGHKNHVVHSRLYAYDGLTEKSSLSVKLVLSGTERYRIDSTRYDLQAGEFLLVEEAQEVHISFEEKELAEGICFFLDEEYLRQTFSLMSQTKLALDKEVDLDSVTYPFVAKKYSLTQSDFGKYLQKVCLHIQQNKDLHLSEDFFFDFLAQLVHHQSSIFPLVNKLKSAKLSTRKELYRRIEKSKDYIMQNLSQSISIRELAIVSNLSEVQLHRIFKLIYGCTPYQYILKHKLALAESMIKTKNLTMSDIAISLGFVDLPTFSKAFKKIYKVSPSQYLKTI